MPRRLLIWLERNWAFSTPFLALYGFAILAALRSHMDAALWLIWLQTPVYFLHEFEEYVFPGGFLRFFNRRVLGSDRPDFPLSRTISLWINLPLIFIAFPLTAFIAGQFGVAAGLWVVYFSLLNASGHVAMYFRFGYNPGLVVSLLVNIPVALFTIGYFMMNGRVSGQAHGVGLLIALALNAAVMALGFFVLKPKIKTGPG